MCFEKQTEPNFELGHLQFYHRPSEPAGSLGGCSTGVRLAIIVDTSAAFSPDLGGGLLLVQSGNLCHEFCFEVAVEGVTVQDQQDVVKKFLSQEEQNEKERQQSLLQ